MIHEDIQVGRLQRDFFFFFSSKPKELGWVGYSSITIPSEHYYEYSALSKKNVGFGPKKATPYYIKYSIWSEKGHSLLLCFDFTSLCCLIQVISNGIYLIPGAANFRKRICALNSCEVLCQYNHGCFSLFLIYSSLLLVHAIWCSRLQVFFCFNVYMDCLPLLF